MYKKDKKIILCLIIIVMGVTYRLQWDFKDVASECISVVSIALAIYTICISSLIGSGLLNSLKNSVDKNITYKTELGVLKSYLENAVVVSIVTIMFACISKVAYFENNDINRLFSAFCFAVFTLNFMFIWLIFIFIMNKQVDT